MSIGTGPTIDIALRDHLGGQLDPQDDVELIDAVLADLNRTGANALDELPESEATATNAAIARRKEAAVLLVLADYGHTVVKHYTIDGVAVDDVGGPRYELTLDEIAYFAETLLPGEEPLVPAPIN